MTGEFFGFYTTGGVSYLSKSQEVDMLVSNDTVLEGADNEGWLPVLEDNGMPRAIKTDRVVEGYISSERLDTQMDVVPLTAFTVERDNEESMPLIEYIAKRAPLIFQHASTEKGVVPMGVVVGYKVEDDKPKFRWAVFKGSDLVDECWAEMKKYGTNGGFSIGGAKMEPECDDQKCVLNKLDVVEVSWTPDPANVEAKATFLSRVAKAMKQRGPGRLGALGIAPAWDEELPEKKSEEDEEEDEDLEKPCPWKKEYDAVKASDMDDGVKKTILAAMKGSNLPRIQELIDEGEELQLDEDEDKKPTKKETRTSISESHTHYECDSCGHVWEKQTLDTEEYIDISDVSCPECGSDSVWEETRSRYMATEKAAVKRAWSFQIIKFKITNSFTSALSRARRKHNP